MPNEPLLYFRDADAWDALRTMLSVSPIDLCDREALARYYAPHDPMLDRWTIPYAEALATVRDERRRRLRAADAKARIRQNVQAHTRRGH